MASEIRANKSTNRAGLGTVTYADTGIIVSGIVTCTELSGLTALNISGVGTANTLDINGDIDVDGHTNLDNVSVAGIATFSGILDATNTPASIRVAQDIQHKGDATTKISFPTNGEISFDTSGHDRIYIKSNGRIGMGTVTPANDIHHFSDGLNGNSFRLENREGYITLINDANGLYLDAEYFNFRNRAGSTSYASINTSGNFSVFYDLDVDGHTNLDNVSIAGITTFANNINVTGNIFTTKYIYHTNDTDTYFDFGTNTINLAAGGNIGLTILDSSVRVTDKLGINGAAPQTPLDVIANGSGYAINIRGRSSDNIGEIRFTSNNYGSLYSVLQTGATYLKFQVGSAT
ncbi:MAG: hypothetical protein VXY93_11400, partial [Pseudomonadota bacterium]|nr:hypothetical protein [Pseudomonadota bacterium]